MKSIIIIILLLPGILTSQTVEERLTRLERAVFGDTISTGNDTTLAMPVYEGIVLQSTNSDRFIFNPAQISNNTYYIYYTDNGFVKLATSVNGLNGFNIFATNSPAGSIRIEGNKVYATAHKWFNNLCDNYYYMSLDGLRFEQTAIDRTQQSGEDRNLLYDNGLWRCYIRKQPIPRTIGYSESSDFRNWTRITEILKPDAQDGNLKQFYHLSVIKTSEGYFGLLNVYRVGNSGQDVWQMPPYTTDEHTVDVQLVWSANGVNNWLRLNNRKVFINRKPEIQQLFAWWSVIGDECIIYTAESKRKHTDWANANDKNNKFYFSSRYKILLTELYKYKD